MNNEFLIYLGFFVLIFIFIILLYLKDGEIMRKIARYEGIMEDIIRQNYQLKKILEESHLKKDEQINEFEYRIKDKINQELNERVFPVLESLRGIEALIESFQNEQQSRLSSLEEKTKTISKITPPPIEAREKQILELFKTGKTALDIAKTLRLGIGTVEFVLRMHNLIK